MDSASNLNFCSAYTMLIFKFRIAVNRVALCQYLDEPMTGTLKNLTKCILYMAWEPDRNFY